MLQLTHNRGHKLNCLKLNWLGEGGNNVLVNYYNSFELQNINWIKIKTLQFNNSLRLLKFTGASCVNTVATGCVLRTSLTNKQLTKWKSVLRIYHFMKLTLMCVCVCVCVKERVRDEEIGPH